MEGRINRFQPHVIKSKELYKSAYLTFIASKENYEQFNLLLDYPHNLSTEFQFQYVFFILPILNWR